MNVYDQQRDHYLGKLLGVEQRRRTNTEGGYRLSRLLRASGELDLEAGAPLEKLASDQLAAIWGCTPRATNSVFIGRDLTQASASGGGYLVSGAEELVAGVPGRSNSFLDLCTVVRARPGAGQQQVGRFDALPTVTVLANEGASISETTPATSRTLLNASNCGTYVEHSRQWALQTAGGADALVTLLTNALRNHVQQQIIEGSGASGQVLGLVNDTAVTSASGTTLAWSTVCTTMEVVEKAGGDGALAWVVTAAAAKLMRQRAVIAGGEAILDGANRIGGYPVVVIGGTTSAHAVFGRWSDLIVHQWSPLEVAVSPFAAFALAVIGVRGWISFNAAPIVNGSFAVISTIT